MYMYIFQVFLTVADNIITPSRGDKWSAIKKKVSYIDKQL